LTGTEPAWASGAKPIGPARSTSALTTQVYLAGDASGLTAYAQAVSDPQSRDYLRFLSPAQVDSRFSAGPRAVAAVENWLVGSGLKVSRVSPDQIDATGTIADTEEAYGTKLYEFKTSAGTFRAPDSNARVPASIAGDLLSIGGLENRPTLMHPADLVTQLGTVRPGLNHGKLPMSTGADGAPYLGPTPCSSYWGQHLDTTDPEINGAHQPYDICGYTPSQLRGAYDLTARQTGAGVTVAIVDAYASSTITADADKYAADHGARPFGHGQFKQTATPAQWTDQAVCGDWSPEETLDVEAVHALAPNANIHYYGANSCNDSDFLAVLSSIVDHRSADVINDSWGEVISSTAGNEPPSTIAVYNQLFQRAVAEGIEVVFAAGDCGAEVPTTVCGAADTSSQPQADFPSSDPYVTSVGGTAVEIGKRRNFERAVPWGDDGSVLAGSIWLSLASDGYQPNGWLFGGGGGASGPSITQAFPGFSQPWYQKGVVPASLAESLPTGQTASSPMRVTPDVSMDADPYTGFLIGETQLLPDGSTGYAESSVGGTSLATALFAALVADSQQSHRMPRGFVNPTLYWDYSHRAGYFHEIVSPAASSAPYTILASGGITSPPMAIQLGDDQPLIATPGYNDATGVGMPGKGVLPKIIK
jgi:subtilase family serine protease